MLIERPVRRIGGIIFDGKVGTLGSLPKKEGTVFDIEKDFDGDVKEFEEWIHGRLKGLQILSEVIDKNKMGGYKYSAKVRNLTDGIPDLSGRRMDVRTFDVGGHFSGVKLYQVVKVNDMDEKYVFIKYILGELKHSSFQPKIVFTAELWDKVHIDFREQENHIRARMARQGIKV